MQTSERRKRREEGQYRQEGPAGLSEQREVWRKQGREETAVRLCPGWT